MNDDRISSQIEGLGVRRLAGCAMWWAVMVIVGGIAIGLVVKHSPDKATRAAVGFALSGLLIGLVTSILAEWSRRVMYAVFLVLPVLFSVGMFFYRTTLGYADTLPLRMVTAPLFLSGGFVFIQISRNIRHWIGRIS